MCGGGGRSRHRGRTRTTSAVELERRADRERQNNRYNTELNDYLKDRLKDFNDRDIDAIRTHLETIQNALGQEIDIVDLLFGGSVSRHTYLKGLSDVDVLAILDDAAYQEKTPQEVLEIFASLLRERLPRTDITVGNLSVTVKFSDGHEIQVLPAVKTSTGIRIADPQSNDWSRVIKPQRFAKKLTEVNQKNGGMVVRVIKLFKAMNAKLPNEERLKGYHIESLAIKAFENYQGNLSYKDMLIHFIDKSRTYVESPIEDSTGQSIHVDDYLGQFWSTERMKRRDALNNLYNKVQQAEINKSVSQWKELLD